jgi:hypothetical protein
MKTYAVITSMDDAYFQKVGKACIESFGAHWPPNVHLYVFDEGIVGAPKRKWVTYLPWSSLDPEFDMFCERNTGSRTQTFAKKAFSVIAGMKTIDVDRLIWLDADVVTTYPLNLQLLNLITPSNVLSTHYGVIHPWPTDSDPDRMSFSCETGFFIVNRKHAHFDLFLQRYTEYYVQDLGHNLRRFYDGEVYGAVVKEFEENGIEMLELNPEYRHKTPIPRSIMSPYIMHYKAGAKDSWTSDLLMKKHNILDEDSNISQVSTQ